MNFFRKIKKKHGRLCCAALAAFFLFACNRLDVISITINDIEFKVEVAIKQDDLTRGLKFRKSMDQKKGMLFIFSRDDYRRFWMQDTYIPLSIAYISSSGFIKEIHDMIPLSEVDVVSRYPVRFALELNQGAFELFGIRAGDRIIFPDDFYQKYQ